MNIPNIEEIIEKTEKAHWREQQQHQELIEKMCDTISHIIKYNARFGQTDAFYFMSDIINIEIIKKVAKIFEKAGYEVEANLNFIHIHWNKKNN